MTATPTHEAASLAVEWARAWNACDAERLGQLVHPEFRMHRMKGDVIDRDGLREAVAAQTYGAAMKLVLRRLYGRGDRFAAAARIEFRSAEDGALMGATDDAGIAVEVRDGVVVVAAPKPTLQEALDFAGVTEADLIVDWETS